METPGLCPRRFSFWGPSYFLPRHTGEDKGGGRPQQERWLVSGHADLFPARDLLCGFPPPLSSPVRRGRKSEREQCYASPSIRRVGMKRRTALLGSLAAATAASTAPTAT